MTTYFVVEFGDLAAARDFVNAIADLGHRSTGMGSRVRITEDTVASLRRQSRAAGVTIRDITTRDLVNDSETNVPCVRMGDYAYPVRAESARPAIATRLAFTRHGRLDR